MANHLKRAKQEAAIRCLVEGTSVRATERITGVHRDTILRLMVRVGSGCEVLLDGLMRDLTCRRLQCDEIWGFVGKKQRHVKPEDNPKEVGDFWTFVALDADTKLVPCYRVGKRDNETADAFINDLVSRLANRVQLSTDGLNAYITAVEWGFYNANKRVDYAQIVKSYVPGPPSEGRYSPPNVLRVTKKHIIGAPDPAHVSTSFVERQNLTMRMSMRRLTRLTNAFSKKLDNLKAAVALHFAHYNLCRIHRTLRVTPAMEAGVTKKLWTIEDLVDRSLEAAKPRKTSA